MSVLLQIILAIVGTGGFVGGIYTLYTMRPKKESEIINNLKSVIDEIRNNHDQYREENNKKMQKLEERVGRMEKRDMLQKRAINLAYRCRHPQQLEECPVIASILENKEELDNTES